MHGVSGPNCTCETEQISIGPVTLSQVVISEKLRFVFGKLKAPEKKLTKKTNFLSSHDSVSWVLVLF